MLGCLVELASSVDRWMDRKKDGDVLVVLVDAEDTYLEIFGSDFLPDCLDRAAAPELCRTLSKSTYTFARHEYGVCRSTSFDSLPVLLIVATGSGVRFIVRIGSVVVGHVRGVSTRCAEEKNSSNSNLYHSGNPENGFDTSMAFRNDEREQHRSDSQTTHVHI